MKIGITEQALRARVAELEAENAQLRQEGCALAGQLADYVSTVDNMKLQLILCGALRRPPTA